MGRFQVTGVLVLLDVLVIFLSSIIVVTPNGYCLVPLLHSVSHIVISSILSPINSHIKYHIQKVMKMSPEILSFGTQNCSPTQELSTGSKKELPTLIRMSDRHLMKLNEVTFKENSEFQNVTSQHPPPPPPPRYPLL
jgi:hypothetical protein